MSLQGSGELLSGELISGELTSGLYLPELYVPCNGEYTFVFGFRKYWLSFSNTPIHTRLCLRCDRTSPQSPEIRGKEPMAFSKEPTLTAGRRKALLRTDEFRKLQKKFVYLNSTCFSNPGK